MFQILSLALSHLIDRRTFAFASALSVMPEISSPPPVRWGIVGLGDVTQRKSGPPFWKANGSELVAVMRRTPGKAVEWAQRVPGGNCVGYESIEAFLAHPELDAVYVATRPGSHLEICRKVAAAGIANVYVEKPVGRNAAETIEMANLFPNGFYTAYISRAYDRTRNIRNLLQNGAIGKVEKVTYHLIGTGGARDIAVEGDLPWRFDVNQSGGGLIMDVGCHIIDRIDYLLGDALTQIVGRAERRDPNGPGQVEDYVSFTASTGSGTVVSCTWDFANLDREEETDSLEFTGSSGSIRCQGMSPSGPVELFDSKGQLVSTFTFVAPEHTAQAMIQAVTDDIRGISSDDTSFLSNGDNAIRTAKVLDQVLNSYYGGR